MFEVQVGILGTVPKNVRSHTGRFTSITAKSEMSIFPSLLTSRILAFHQT